MYTALISQPKRPVTLYKSSGHRLVSISTVLGRNLRRMTRTSTSTLWWWSRGQYCIYKRDGKGQLL